MHVAPGATTRLIAQPGIKLVIASVVQPSEHVLKVRVLLRVNVVIVTSSLELGAV